jgi:hypothetical protein
LSEPPASAGGHFLLALQKGPAQFVNFQFIGIRPVLVNIGAMFGDIRPGVSNLTAMLVSKETARVATGPKLVNTESMSLNRAAMLINTGAMLVNTGVMSVNTGVMLASTGAMLVNTGAMSVNTRAMSVNTRAMSVNTRAMSVNTGAMSVNTGVRSAGRVATVTRETPCDSYFE